MTKIIVTGGSGCLGFAIFELSKESKHEWLFPNRLKCDLLDYNQVKNYFLSSKPDVVIHAAAHAGSGTLGLGAPADIFEINTRMYLNVLKAAVNAGATRLIQIGSIASYPENKENIAFSELQLHSGLPRLKDLPYAFSKRMMSVAGNAFSEQYDIDICTVIVNGIVGPNMHLNDGKEVLLGGLLSRFNQAPQGDKLIVFGNKNSKREYTYSLDLAEIIALMIDNFPSEKLLNIGNTQQYTILELATFVCDALGLETDRIHFPDQELDIDYQHSDNSLFLSKYSYKYTSIPKAIKLTSEWFKEHGY